MVRYVRASRQSAELFLSRNRMQELLPKIEAFVKRYDYDSGFGNKVMQNGAYTKSRAFNDSFENKCADYVSAYETIVQKLTDNKEDYLDNLILYGKQYLGLSDKEIPYITTNLTIQNRLIEKLS